MQLQVNSRAIALHPAQTNKNEGILLIQLQRKSKNKKTEGNTDRPVTPGENGRKIAVMKDKHSKK